MAMKGKLASAKAKDQDVDVAFYDDYEAILAAVIDEKYLLEVSGATTLKKIEYLNMQVDTTTQSLLELPDLLPTLKHLALDNSTIGSIRDLGVGLRCLLSLSLSSCGLYELDGIGVLTGLQELNLADNYISDVTPLAMHENLQNLNLTGNRVSDLSFGDVLASCPKLRALFLTRNPVERAPSYRAIVAYLMPGIEMLDGLPLDASLSQKVNHGVLMEASSALKLLAEEQEDEQRLESDLLGPAHNGASLVFQSSATTARSTEMSQALQPSLTAATTAVAMSGELIPDTGSELTHGSAVVLAGNAAMAIRKRRTGRVAPTPQVCEEKEFESALDVLDSALSHACDPPARGALGPASVQGLREGDITEVMTGYSSPHPHARHLALEALAGEARRGSALELDVGSLGSAQRRPGSALPSSSARRATEKPSPAPRSSSARGDSPEQAIAPFSPRQRNSSRDGSRPHTAMHPSAHTSSSSSSSSLMNACFVPFVFGSPRSASGQDSDDDDEPSSARRHLATKKEHEDLSGSAVLAKTRSTGASIVHLDIVKRPGQTEAHEVLEDVEDEERGSDTEDIAITHRERLRLMSSTANNSNASLLKTRQGVLLKLRGAETSAAGGSLPRQGLPPAGPPSRLPPSSSSARSVASKAGSSLGFNLAGSLAAIDQWVQDMASEDDSDDPSPLQKPLQTQLALAGKGPGMRGLVRTAKEAEADEQERGDDSCGDEDDDGEEEEEGRVPRSARVLSRDAIFQMCAESRQVGKPRTARTQASVSGPPPGAASTQIGSCSLFPSSASSSTENTPASKRKAVASAESSRVTPVPPPLLASPGETKRPSRPVDDQKAALMSKVSKKAMSSGQPQHASSLSDHELVELLRQPPKTVPMLRTKAGFQDFFRGLTSEHFQKLVAAAYVGIADAEDRDAKIRKRMEIMTGALRE